MQVVNYKLPFCAFFVLTLIAGNQLYGQAPIIQPGPPGQPGRIISAQEASDLAGIQYSAGDVMFLQGMISHHAQAMEMSALVDARTNREPVRLLAQRISLSQEDEISMMQDWLDDRGLDAPSIDAHHSSDFQLMPGMLSADDIEQLEQSEGDEFDRLFLSFMIEHHEGALEMVDNLLDQQGAAQDPVLYAFTSDVTSDQGAEIDRMDAMLAGFSPDPRVNLAPGFRDAGEASLNVQLLVSLPKPEGFYDPDNPSGVPNRSESEEILEPQDPADASVTGEEEVANEEAASGLAETPAEEDEEDENADPRPSLLRFSNTDLLFLVVITSLLEIIMASTLTI